MQPKASQARFLAGKAGLHQMLKLKKKETSKN